MKIRTALFLLLLLTGTCASAIERHFLTQASNWRDVKAYTVVDGQVQWFADAVGTARYVILYADDFVGYEINSTQGVTLQTVVYWDDYAYGSNAHYTRYGSRDSFVNYITGIPAITWTAPEVANSLQGVMPTLSGPYTDTEIKPVSYTPSFSGSYYFW